MKKILLIFLCAATFLAAQNPKREFRSTWIASVTNLDWPSTPFLPVHEQKAELIEMLDQIKEANINVVMFQIRPECDALYKSPYETWSYWLTGSQGTPPSPLYDPLEFAIEEAHKRGIELHAWFNPYRAVKKVGLYSVSPNHISNTHTEWILDFGTIKILDPGLPEVREYNAKIIADVIRRYDIDGIHMDDYFYPYPPDQISNQDDATFQQHNNGFTNRGDWRRDNVNRMMAMIMDSVNTIKPYLKFGISPFGIWKNHVPSNISGMDAYNVIYADPMAWLREHSIDYLTPQLYWKIGGSQDYVTLSTFWADSADAYGRHMYPGHIFNKKYSSAELVNQLDIDRGNAKIKGSVFFKASDLVDNMFGFHTVLKNSYYKDPALPPLMDWKDSTPPNAPQNIVFERVEGTAYAALQWEKPSLASDNDSAFFYALYKFADENAAPSDFDNNENILDIVGAPIATYPKAIGDESIYITVTSLDRSNNESGNSNYVQVTRPELPLLASPADQADDAEDTLTVKWNYAERAGSYGLQVASDENFENLLIDESGLLDTTYTFADMDGLTKYYWRTKAENLAGESEYTGSFSYTTAFPGNSVAIYPPDRVSGVPPTNFDFEWNSTEAAEEYHIQAARSRDFAPGSVVLDTVIVADTSFYFDGMLALGSFHFWRVRGSNQYGDGKWSEPHYFKTSTTGVDVAETGVPQEYNLSQNYPNPFNPETRIDFQITRYSNVSLKVYNMLGELVTELVNKNLGAGYYSATFDASSLPSGIYIYSLRTDGFVSSKKMLLLK